jgi:hypothetical protein
MADPTAKPTADPTADPTAKPTADPTAQLTPPPTSETFPPGTTTTFCSDPVGAYSIVSGQGLFGETWESYDCLFKSNVQVPPTEGNPTMLMSDDAYEGDVTVTATMMVKNDIARDFGILFHVSDTDQGANGYASDGYVCKFGTPGSGASGTAVLDVKRLMSDGRENLGTSTPFSFSSDTFYTMEVRAYPNGFYCKCTPFGSVSALGLVTISDSTHYGGQVGLWMWRDDYGPHYARSITVDGTLAA